MQYLDIEWVPRNAASPALASMSGRIGAQAQQKPARLLPGRS